MPILGQIWSFLGKKFFFLLEEYYCSKTTKFGIFGQFGPGHAGLFGALLVGRLVVVARGLYLARHLFTLCINVNFFKSNAFCFLSMPCIVKAPTLWKWFHFVQNLYCPHVSSLFILSQMFVQAGSNSKQTISSLELFSSGFLCNGETKSPRRPPRLVDTNKSGTELVSKGKLYQQHHILENINDRTWIHPDCV